MTQVLGWELAGYGGAAAVLSMILASVLLAKFNLYREALLSVCSLLLCSFLVFGLVEIFPDLARSLHLTSIHYYAIRERYITDDKLILINRPFYRHYSTGLKGDLYKPIYGVDVPEFSYKGTADKNGFRNTGDIRHSDVVLVGDSFIEIGESDAELLTSMLERISGLRVVNLGVGWYGPFQYLETFKRYGVDRQPKYAVFSFFEGNDLKDIPEYVHWARGGDYYHFNLSSKGVLGRYRLALRESIEHLMEIAKAVAKSVAANESRERTAVHPDIVDLNLGGQHYKARFGYNIDTRDVSQLPQTDEFKELRKLLIEFQTMCREHQIVPLLMFIPTKVHIYADYSTKLSGANWTSIRETQIAAKDNVRNAIIGLANELHLQTIDLTPPFEASAQEGKMLYYPFDTHWNPVGREVAAEEIARVLGTRRHN